jgi:hypothetical protein
MTKKIILFSASSITIVISAVLIAIFPYRHIIFYSVFLIFISISFFRNLLQYFIYFKVLKSGIDETMKFIIKNFYYFIFFANLMLNAFIFLNNVNSKDVSEAQGISQDITFSIIIIASCISFLFFILVLFTNKLYFKNKEKIGGNFKDFIMLILK